MISSDNSAERWCNLSDVVELGAQVPVAVRVQPDVVAIDGDVTLGEPGREALEARERISVALREAGLDPVLLASGGEGRWHLFCRVPDRSLRDRVRRAARRHGLDVRSKNNLIRLPGTPHRSGAPVTLLSHHSWQAAADALGGTHHDSSVIRRGPQTVTIGAPVAGGPVGERLRALIRDGDTEGRYPHPKGGTDGSRLVMAICSLAASEGLARDRVFDVLASPQNAGGDALRRRLARNRRVGRAWFLVTWEKAAASVRTRRIADRAGALGELVQVEEAAAHARFTGRTASSTVAVLTAALELARQRGGVQAPMSVRELAERAGVNTSTVQTALARLRIAGWLQLVGRAEGDRAAVYACRVPTKTGRGPEERRAEPGQPQSTSGGVGTVRIWRDKLPEDAFAHGALGKGALRVLEVLERGGESQSAAQVSAALGMHPGSVRRLLAKLHAAGLAVHSPLGWTCRSVSEVARQTLDALAGAVLGRAERRLEKHAYERIAFQEWLADRELAGGSRLLRWPRRPEEVLARRAA